MTNSNNDETEKRLKTILGGAFKASPTPLKKIAKTKKPIDKHASKKTGGSN